MQMARGAADGETNLAVGEPYFLQQELLRRGAGFRFQWPMAYPSVGGEPELIAELRRQFPYKHIVVTNGAKQAIEAAFYAFKTVERRSVVSHQPPYWPSYPTLAKSQGMDFNVAAPRAAVVRCITSPNNPDGGQQVTVQTDSWADLWDGVYAQPLYGYQGIAPWHRVGVFSAAKQLGLSGIRVGWLGTDEPDIARAAAYFVEITTSGVSILSQEVLAHMLRAMRHADNMAFYTERTLAARDILMANGSAFRAEIGSLCSEVYGVPRDGTGMFAWFRAERPESMTRALRDAKVKVVSGDACGQYDPGWFRMSMGHSLEVTRPALQRVREQYWGGWISK